MQKLFTRAFRAACEKRNSKLLTAGIFLLLASALSGCRSPETSAVGIAVADAREEAGVKGERVCVIDRFRQPEAPAGRKIDVLFVMDNSESMNRHWQLMAAKIDRLMKEFPENSDLRFAVVLGTVEKYYGRLFSAPGVPAVLDGTKLNAAQVSAALRRTFTEALKYTDRTGAGEALFYSLYYAATTRAGEIQAQGFFRPDAALQVMLMSDDAEIGTKYPSRQPWNLPPKCNYNHHESVRKSHYLPRGISTDTTFRALQRLKGEQPLSTNAFVNITKEDILVDNDPNAECIFDSPGYGYFDIVKKSGGVLYSIHHERGEGLARTARYLNSRLGLIHDFQLSKPADQIDPAFIEARVDGAVKPHTYSALTNVVRLEDAGRAGSEVAIRHCEPEQRREWSMVGWAGTAGRREATLKWQTPELATYGRVLYGRDRENLTGVADSAQGTEHEVLVMGLEPNTQYFFQAVGWDHEGVEKKSEIMALATQPDWEMSAVTGESSRNSASLSWRTDYPTAGRLYWGTSPDALFNETGETAAAEAHTVVVSGLEPNSVYYFQAVSRDGFGLEKESEVVELRTVADWTIVGFKGEAGRSGAALQWETPDYPTTGRVIYGFSPDSMDQTLASGATGNFHRVEVTNLSPGTQYFFQVVGRDDLGAIKRSQVISLRTVNDWSIGEFRATSSETSLDVKFSTVGYPTSGKILWGLSADALTETALTADGATEHGALLENLAPDTLYYLQAVARDNLGVEKRSEVLALRTRAEVRPPVWNISDVTSQPEPHAVKLHWKTSAYDTVGRVFFGTSPEILDQASESVGPGKNHEVRVAGLVPDTLYYFQVVAMDDQGQEQRSAVFSARTLSVNVPEWKIQGFDGSTTGEEAVLIWQTLGVATKATVRVGMSATDLNYKTVEVPEFKTVHLTTVPGLLPSTTYYFQVTATDEAGRAQTSGLLVKRTKDQ